MKKQSLVCALGLLFFFHLELLAVDIKVKKTDCDLSKEAFNDAIWKDLKAEKIPLTAQPMVAPRPKTTLTSSLLVQSLQDGKWIAFRLTWRTAKKAEAGCLHEFSDAMAIQFPVKDGPPPPIFMGMKDNPVHIFHWRAQHQKDVDKGKPSMKELYPNMNPDMYPMDFKDSGKIKDIANAGRESYSPGIVAGNPQSFQKTTSVDEIIAEGFGTSTVVQNQIALGKGVWKNGEWSVIITRPLQSEKGSILNPTKDNFIAFAVWQGAKKEVGSRKSVTMSWIPLLMSGGQK